MKEKTAVKESKFPASLFAFYAGVLLLMSGIHTGIIVFMNRVHLNEIVQSIIPIIYWGLAAVGITIYTRRKVKKTYEEPLKLFARATRAVAKGDFSVYMPVFHTSDKLDYLDIMILDFNKMVEELGSIETLKTDFVSNVSHEMKTPISIIRNYAQLLQKSNLSEEEKIEYTQTIIDSSSNLSDLISNILKMNKLENQKMTLDIKAYDICRQLCDSILQFENAWEKKAIELEIDIEDRATVYADEGLLALVWNNLMSNAVKFTEIGGGISIKQISDEATVTVIFADTGCGMDDKTKQHIFDKFYQGDTSHSNEGNGMGLALVKRILDIMNGAISVESREGKGSTFTVTIPVNRKDGE